MQVKGHGLPVLISVDNSDLNGSAILAKLEKKGWSCTSPTPSLCIAPGKIRLPLGTKHPQKKKKSIFPSIAKESLCLTHGFLVHYWDKRKEALVRNRREENAK